MKKTIEVDITDKSDALIAETFGRYRESGALPARFDGLVVVHLYPLADTREPDGSLAGYYDALFLRVVVYDTVAMTRHTIDNRDSLDFVPGVHIKQVRVFKDLSTMIVIMGPVSFRWNQGVTIAPV